MSEELDLNPENKRVAMLIAVLALVLAICETLSKGYQTEVLTKNIESANLWSFYQAKAIRQSSTQLAIDSLKLSDKKDDPAVAETLARWQNEVARYGSDPSTHEGRKELAERAKHAEEEREEAHHRYHSLEISVAMLQIAIVLASASVLTTIVLLAWAAGALGVASIGLAVHAVFVGGSLF